MPAHGSGWLRCAGIALAMMAGVVVANISEILWVLAAVVVLSVGLWADSDWPALCDRMGWGIGSGDDAGLGLGVDE